MGRRSGATTVIRAYGVLAGILDDAVKARRLRGQSGPRCGEPAAQDGASAACTCPPMMSAGWPVSPGEHRVLVLVLAYCGIRWGEAVALRVRDVEFLRRRLSVHDNAVQLGVDHAVGLTKSRQQRSVPVPQFVLDELSVQCQGRGMDDLVFGDGEHYLPRPKSTGGWFAGAVKRAKVQKITPHDLRHTCASIAISSGVNVLALSRMLGHTSAKVTLDTYADLFDTDLDAVRVSSRFEVCPKCAQTGAQRPCSWPEIARLNCANSRRTWRWRRDLNPRTGVTRHTLSRRAP